MSNDHAECQAALNTARRLTAEAIDAGARQAAKLQAEIDGLWALLPAPTMEAYAARGLCGVCGQSFSAPDRLAMCEHDRDSVRYAPAPKGNLNREAGGGDG